MFKWLRRRKRQKQGWEMAEEVRQHDVAAGLIGPEDKKLFHHHTSNGIYRLVLDDHGLLRTDEMLLDDEDGEHYWRRGKPIGGPI